MTINEELKKLYERHFDRAVKAIPKDEKISSPLLIKIREEKYKKSDKKVMIVGQETFGWQKEFGSKPIEDLMAEYDSYLNNNIRGRDKRAFWKAFHDFEKKLKTHYKGEQLYFFWDNIVKVGRANSKGMTKGIRDFEREYFSVFSQEVEILKPDIVIFLTGPDRDNDIKYNFNNITFDKLGYPSIVKDKRNYKTPSKIVSDKLPKKTIRLYHPNYWGGFNAIKQMAFEMLLKD